MTAFIGNVGTATAKTSSTGATVTVGAAGVAAGDVLVAVLCAAVAGVTPNTPTDANGNTYTADPNGQTTSGVPRINVWVCKVATALVSGDTISFTWPSSSAAIAIAVDHFDSTSPTTFGNGANATGLSTGSTTPSATEASHTDGIVMGILGLQTISTEGFTEDTDSTGGDTWHSMTVAATSGSTTTSNVTNRRAYKLPTSLVSQTYNPTLGTSRAWSALIACLYTPPPPSQTVMVV